MNIRLTLLFILILNFSFSRDYFWIGKGEEWNNPLNWSYTSGGGTANEIPSKNDNVIFDHNSFHSESSKVLYSSVEVNSFVFNTDKKITFWGGDFTVHHQFNLYKPAEFSGNLIFANENNQSINSVNTQGFPINANLIFKSGNWELNNHLITDYSKSILISCSTFKTNEKSIATGSFVVKNTKASLNNSHIITTHQLNLNEAKKIGGNPIIYTNGGQSDINLGNYKDSDTKDQTVTCTGGLVLDLTITADYNGQNISCNGLCDGELTISASGTAGPYGYKFNNTGPFTNQTVFGGLCAGTYSVTVIDSSQQLAPGVFVQCTINDQITEPAVITFNVLGVVQPSCPGVCDGQAFTNASGGTGTLVINWPASGETTANPVGLCVGVNPVNLVDDNGCTATDQVLVTDPQPITYDVTITPPTCNGDSDAEILISNEAGGNGGPYTYSFNPVPGNGQGSNPATGYSSGNVTVSVFDVNGCQQNTTVNIADPPILSISAGNPTAVSCFGICDGTATTTTNGGTPNYSFEWFDNSTGLTTGITDENPSTLCAGNYFVVVTDASGCTAQSNVITIGSPTQILANAQSYDVSCFGVCDGSVDVDPSGGTTPYSYNWVTVPGGSGVGASDSLSGLCPGQFEIVVTDANGCQSTPDTVEVLDQLPLGLTLSGTDPNCYDICDGDISATVTGGVTAYNYSWSPNPPVGQGTSTISSLCGGIQYTLLVTDVNGCTVTDNTTLNNPNQYDITVSQTDLLCFGDVNGSISATVNLGGNGGPYTYTWAPGNPTGQGTPSVTNLAAGNYTLTVSGGVSCDTTLTFTISEPSQLNTSTSVISHVSCNGDCNGSAQVTINGGTSPYNVQWDDPSNQTTNVASNLCAGNYNVSILDANNCPANGSVTINEPNNFDITVSQTDLTCFNICSGTATVTVNSGGTAPYTISWDDPSNQNTFTATNLCAGTYNATVTDANLCDTILTFIITEPTELTVAVNINNSACFGTCSGQASLTVNGGNGGYTYQWFDANTNANLGINTPTISNLCPGSYYAVVTDINGCSTTTSPFSISELPQINSSVVSSNDASCGSCNGDAEIQASGGAGSFTYLWSPAPGAGQGSTIGTGLCAGVYNVSITDASGCTSSQSVNINSVALEVLNLDSVDVSCFGVCDGQAIASYVCLESPCTIEWFDLATGISTGIIGDVTPATLCGGTYIAQLTNNLGCVTSDTIVVNSPPQITGTVNPTDVDCFNACNGSAVATGNGGTGTLTYTWNPIPGSGQNTTNAGGLCAGNWDLTISDANGCTTNIPFTINEPNDITINNVSATDISCFGSSDGTVTVLASNGTPPLSYEWFLCGTSVSIGTGSNIGGLSPGDYYAVVTDANGCSKATTCVTVGDKNELTAILNASNSSCFGFCNGLIDVVPSGGDGNYFYQWLDDLMNPIAGQTNDTISNICQGTYNVQITDGNGCSIIEGPIDLTQPSNPWSVTSSTTDITCFGTCDGTATVTVNSGNTPPYTYLWDDPSAQATPTATNLCPGTYNVTIFDAGSCDTTIQITIFDALPFNTGGIQTDISCFGDCNGSATVNPTGGTSPYVITWDNGDLGSTASNLCAGNVTATMTDANGCALDTTFTIIEPNAPLQTNTVFSNNSTCGACNGSATINVIGGTHPYTYVWTGNPTGQGTNSVSGLCAGIISVTVTDANGCSVSEVFPITDINGEVLTMNGSDASCFGTCDGGAEVTFTCSDPTCSVEWFDATSGASTGITSTTISNLCAGDYFVTVTNNSLCVSNGFITINEPSQIIANEIITSITCNGSDDASITLTPSGGSGAGYTYNWNPVPPNGNGTNQATNLGPGLWSVDITDGSGCVETYDFNLTEPSTIDITPTFTDVTCNGSCDGSISLNVSGGYGTYTYQWYMNGTAMPGETNPNINNLCPGNYNVEVTDMGGCTVTLNNDITVSEPFSISSPITSTDVTCNGYCDGTATVTPSGGTLPYIINWYDATNTLIGQTGTNAVNLCPGDYYTIVTDANNCMFTTNTVTISENAALTHTITINDASCFGLCDGDAAIIVNGGALPYTYTWLDVLDNPIPGGTSPNVSNLCAGNYTIEVIDANGCSTGEQNVVINGATEITANLFSNDATCGVNDGNATVNPSGGTPGYTYQWYDASLNSLAGETNQILLNVGSGVYFVDVTDANGCTQQFSVTISDIPSTTLTWDNITYPTCFGANDGAIEATVTGTNLPLSFVWNPGGYTTEDISNLTAGSYTLMVTDALGCINFYDTTLIEPSEITVTPTITDSDCNLCNGEISVFLNGGTGVLTSVWNNGATGTLVSNLCPAIYEITVTDGNGCSQTDQISVGNNSGLTATSNVSAINCINACDGEITISGVGGTAPYSYNWLNFTSSNQTESNLCADTYFIEVTDAIGCTYPIDVELIEPVNFTVTEFITPPTCGNTDGSIALTVTGGNPPFTYLWNTTDVTQTISNLSEGIYTVTVTDANGCSQDFNYNLNNSTAPQIDLTKTDLLCNADCIGTISSTVTGGTPTYTYQWMDEFGNTLLGETNPTISNLCAGNYTLQVTDNLGCVSYQTAEIIEPDTILLNTPFVTPISCNGTCDGIITVNPIGGTPGYSFTWDDPNNQTTPNAIDLCTGTYTVDITDANGCQVSQTQNITEPMPIQVVLDSTQSATCVNSADGGIFITISGGNPPLSIGWTQNEKDTVFVEDLTNALPGPYIVEVIDANGCTFVDTFNIDTLLTVLAFAGNDTIVCFEQGVTLNGTSNQTDADFTWFDLNGNILSDTSVLNLSAQSPGNNTYLLNANYSGCDYTDTVVVTTNGEILVDAGPDIELLTNATGVIGGSPTTDITNTIIWTPSTYLNDTTLANPSVISPDEDITYYVTVIDTNGCQNTDSVYVEVIPTLIIPDGISPNGDGKNETWQLVFKDDFPDMEVSVYNRWGELLFYDNTGYANEWDGKYNGEELPVGTYYYVIDVHNELYPDPFTGPITIMR